MTTQQLSLFDLGTIIPISSLTKKAHSARSIGWAPSDLRSYDCILVSSSAGKDSQAMLDYVVELAREQDVLDRVVVVHADLGRVEWEGTKELAEEQARHYGLRFEIVSRIGGVSPGGRSDTAAYQKGDVFGDLLDHVERRGMWPDSGNRYCTSDHKRGPIRKLITRLHREHGKGRAFRLLSCMGLRADESPNRSKMIPFVSGAAPGKDTKESCTKLRHVDTWLPIHHWTEQQVWDRIKASGVRHHRAYDLGMPRLSCAFCIFAPKAALVLAGKHNRALLDEYVRVEAKIDHTFRQNLSLADIQAAVEAGEEVELDDGAWNM